jgi:pimeloyl-ACP methyl ester carboxylesterase
MIAAGDGRYHVRRYGESGPVMLLECGLTMMSSCWGWLAPELSRFARVITYDRAGLGWSTAREGLRDALQIAADLRLVLESLRVSPAVLVGHSMGAIFNRAFLEAGAREMANVRAVVWLDPAHPEQFERPGIRRRVRNFIFYIEAARLLATANAPAIEVPLLRHLDGLPALEFRALRRFLRTSVHLRTSAREARSWQTAAEALRGTTLGDLPLLVLSGGKNTLPEWAVLQEDLARLSTRARHETYPQMSHISMLARREHAIEAAAAARRFLEDAGVVERTQA